VSGTEGGASGRAARRLEEDREAWGLVMGRLGRYAPIEAVSMTARELGISYGTARNRYLRYGDHLRTAKQHEGHTECTGG
jgi:hypothetical protein